MAASSSILSKSLSYTLLPSNSHQSPHLAFPNSTRFSTVRLSGELERRQMRGLSVVTGAGPSNSQLIFAFAFPITLLAVTVFTAFRIGDRLDQKFLEEVAMNEAIREAEEESDDATQVAISRKEEPALSRARNRPKREV
ncbi:Peptidylglycine alpha-hydroxylating monooxygenase [Bienertia sinuspersici]